MAANQGEDGARRDHAHHDVMPNILETVEQKRPAAN